MNGIWVRQVHMVWNGKTLRPRKPLHILPWEITSIWTQKIILGHSLALWYAHIGREPRTQKLFVRFNENANGSCKFFVWDWAKVVEWRSRRHHRVTFRHVHWKRGFHLFISEEGNRAWPADLRVVSVDGLLTLRARELTPKKGSERKKSFVFSGWTIATISASVSLHLFWNWADEAGVDAGLRAKTWYSSASVVSEKMLLYRSERQFSLSPSLMNSARLEAIVFTWSSCLWMKDWHLMIQGEFRDSAWLGYSLVLEEECFTHLGSHIATWEYSRPWHEAWLQLVRWLGRFWEV